MTAEYALLIPNLRPRTPYELTIELKPKWLWSYDVPQPAFPSRLATAQTALSTCAYAKTAETSITAANGYQQQHPSTPPLPLRQRRCTTCALRALHGAKQLKTHTKPTFCPLNLLQSQAIRPILQALIRNLITNDHFHKQQHGINENDNHDDDNNENKHLTNGHIHHPSTHPSKQQLYLANEDAILDRLSADFASGTAAGVLRVLADAQRELDPKGILSLPLPMLLGQHGGGGGAMGCNGGVASGDGKGAGSGGELQLHPCNGSNGVLPLVNGTAGAPAPAHAHAPPAALAPAAAVDVQTPPPTPAFPSSPATNAVADVDADAAAASLHQQQQQQHSLKNGKPSHEEATTTLDSDAFAAAEADAKVQDYLQAMTLRDCTLFVRFSIDGVQKGGASELADRAGGVEVVVADLDRKVPEGMDPREMRKLRKWAEREEILINEGFYHGVEVLPEGVGRDEKCWRWDE